MRKIKDVLRLFYEVKLSQRAIARSLGIGLGTVSTYLQRARKAGISWPLPVDLQERDLGRLLFPSQPVTGQRRFIEPDYPTVLLELKHKGVTKLLLWQEYRQQHLRKADFEHGWSKEAKEKMLARWNTDYGLDLP